MNRKAIKKLKASIEELQQLPKAKPVWEQHAEEEKRAQGVSQPRVVIKVGGKKIGEMRSVNVSEITKIIDWSRNSSEPSRLF